jgi:predicted neutral ceramidase superfamily lipid hydrolase
MEDIPPEVEDTVIKDTENLIKHTCLVDAHNSIGKVTILTKKDVKDLTQAALLAIKNASKKPYQQFQLGIAEIDLKEFGIKEGIGPGGGYLFVIKVSDRSFCYIVIDGNNMIRGLRDKIHRVLSTLHLIPVEIMTTDTHIVNGVVSAKLGYHPVGEAIPPNYLIKRIKQAAKMAEQSLVNAEASFTTGEVKVNTLGLALFSKLSSFMYSISKFVAASFLPVLGTSILLLLFFLS